MKHAIFLTGILLVLLAGMSCTEKFLDRNNADWFTLSDSLYLDSSNETAAFSFELPDRIDTDFSVFMRPRWLTVAADRGKVTAGRVEMSVGIDKSYLPYYPYQHSGTVVFKIEDYGFVSLTVIYTDYGSPTVYCSPSQIVFDGTLSQTFRLFTPSEGILTWEIRDIPAWLTFSKTSGTLLYGETEWITVTVNLNEITFGNVITDTVKITSNSAAGDYLLNISVDPSTLPLPGGYTTGSILTDAEYHHETGIMAICTRSPNQLLLFDMTTGISDTIPLDATPGCISFSPDGSKAVLGYTVAKVGYVDINTAEITNEFSIDCVPSDIVLGDGGWCYITPTTDQWEKIRNLNLNTGQLISSPTSASIYEKTEIKKVPGKPYLIGSQLTVTPSSLIIFDISEGQANDTVSKYHESISHLWPSKDGMKIYTGFGKVYTLPDFDGQFHTGSPPVFGSIDSEKNYIYVLDECPAIESVFVSSSDYWYQPGISPLIERFQTTSLSRTKTYTVQSVPLVISGNTYFYEACPRFIFVNKEGTTMYVLKILRPDYNIEGWFLETLSL